MSGSAIVQCRCIEGAAAKFQDKVYGQNMRVACATAKGDKDTKDVRCTVCSQIHRVNSNRVK